MATTEDDEVLGEPRMFEVTIHKGLGSRIDHDRGDTSSVIQKATVNNFGYRVPYAAKVESQREDLYYSDRS